MPSPRVPIVETVLKAWVDAFRAIRAMPVVALCALVILAVLGVTSWWVSVAVLLSPGRTVQQWLASPTWFVLSLLNTSLQVVLLAPLMMAVQRFVIRREIARWYPLNPLRPSYLHFVGIALAIYLAYRAPELIGLLARSAADLPVGVDGAIWLLTLPLIIAVVIVALRKVALFAAIAAFARNASWRGMAAADAGNTFRIALVMLAVWLPGTVYSALVTAYFPMPRGNIEMGGILLALAVWLPQLPVMSAIAAAVARIYMAIEMPLEAPATEAERQAIA